MITAGHVVAQLEVLNTIDPDIWSVIIHELIQRVTCFDGQCETTGVQLPLMPVWNARAGRSGVGGLREVREDMHRPDSEAQ